MPRWSATTGRETTVLPVDTPAVPGPASRTSAANSWPITRSRPASNTRGVIPAFADAVASRVSSTIRSACWAACRSDPQMPHALVWTSTWPSPGTGSGTSSTTMRPSRRTAAFLGVRRASCRLRRRISSPSVRRRASLSAARSRLRLLFGVLLYGLHDRGARAAHQLAPVLDRSVPGLDQRARRVLQRWHHLAGEQLVGPQRGVRVGPVVGQEEVRAEAAGLVGQPLQLGDRLLRRADDGEAVVDEGVDDGVGALDAFGRERQGG